MANNYVVVNMPDGMIALAKRIPSQQEQIQEARSALRLAINTEMQQNTLQIQNPLTTRNERMMLHRRNDQLIDQLMDPEQYEAPQTNV